MKGIMSILCCFNRIVCIFPQKYKFSTIANMSNSNSKLFFTKELLINSTIHTISSAVHSSRHLVTSNESYMKAFMHLKKTTLF